MTNRETSDGAKILKEYDAPDWFVKGNLDAINDIIRFSKLDIPLIKKETPDSFEKAQRAIEKIKGEKIIAENKKYVTGITRSLFARFRIENPELIEEEASLHFDVKAGKIYVVKDKMEEILKGLSDLLKR